MINLSKRTIYYSITVFFLILFAITAVSIRAHPPDDMQLSYNSNTNTLSVTITHGVADNTTHYIASVEIKVNGTTDQTQLYGSQPDLLSFTYEYTVITNNGSVIQVTAICSVGGSITKTLGGTTGNGDAIPGYIGIILVLFVSVITLQAIIRKKLNRK